MRSLSRSPRVEPPWPTLQPEALHGLPGQLVAAIDPYTEADPVATLAHLLAAVGNLVGPGPHARVQHDAHPARLNVALVGRTGKGRKGTAWSTPRHLLAQVDAIWARRCVVTGLSTGEGLIAMVRDLDPANPRRPAPVASRDPRLLVIEPELAITLKVIAREGNTLSGLLRQAWDSGDLGTLTRHEPLRATGAHVSVVGHITEEEVRRYLTETERANGFANRFLWLLVRRSKALPEGTPPPDALLAPLVEALRGAVERAREVGELRRDDGARALWANVYPSLSDGEPGLVGAILNRAEAQVLRLSLLYALLDGSAIVCVPHLRAALALWAYAETSARRIFGRRLGVPLADVLLEALDQRGSLTATEVSDLFARHRSSDELHRVLDYLVDAGAIEATQVPTRGRPVTHWVRRGTIRRGEQGEAGEERHGPRA